MTPPAGLLFLPPALQSGAAVFYCHPEWRRGVLFPLLLDGTTPHTDMRPRRLWRLAVEGAEWGEERLHGGSTLPRRQGLGETHVFV